jgi:hypothetical protein
MVAEPADRRLDPLERRPRPFEPIRQRRVRSSVVVPDHHEQPVARHEGTLALDRRGHRPREFRGVLDPIERHRGEVAERHVLGEDAAPVGGLPPERVARDHRRHAPPDDRPVDPERPKDLRHLPDVAELVGHVPHFERPSELTRPREAHLQVAHV